MKKLLLIINPIAGKKRGIDFLPEIVKRFEDVGYQVETRYTEIDKNATVVTLNYGEDKDVIVVNLKSIGKKQTIKNMNSKKEKELEIL